MGDLRHKSIKGKKETATDKLMFRQENNYIHLNCCLALVYARLRGVELLVGIIKDTSALLSLYQINI